MRIPRWLAYVAYLLPWLGVAALAFWLLTLRFPLDGQTRLIAALDGRSPWFDPFLPGDRVTTPGTQEGGWIGQRIFNDPVYTSARIPGVYDEVTLEMEARTTRQPLLEFGIQRDPARFDFDLQPAWSEQLAHGWRPVKVGDVEGYVRQSATDRALVDSPLEQTLVWYASTTVPAVMDTSSTEQVIVASLRGALDFYVIPVNGEIAFTFQLQDVNRSRGSNTAAFRLTKDDETVWTEAVGTGGSQETRMNSAFEKVVRIRDLGPGVYRLQFLADDDLFIRKITTKLAHWVIGPRVYFADAVGYATSTPPGRVYTNSRHLSLQTFHKEGLQTVTFGSSGVTLAKTHDVYPLSRSRRDAGTLLVSAPKGDVRMVGDGYFAFTPETLFYPKPRRFTDRANLDEEGIQAVITQYRPPQLLPDGWFRFRLPIQIPPQSDRLRFALSMPGILVRQGYVDVRSVELAYRRPPLRSLADWWKYVRQELVNAWHRL
jgi:hypothetical protein